MGDRATLAKARKELEELYLGVPDDSVNLTFQDLAEVRQHNTTEKKKSSSPSHTMETISESIPNKSLTKLPSLDFNKALEASFQNTNYHHHNYNYQNHQSIPHNNSLHSHHHVDRSDPRGHMYGHDHHHGNAHSRHHDHHGLSLHSGDHGTGGFRHGGTDQRSVVYDDMSHVSGMSVAYGQERGGGRRRPGIPHSNICTICSNYIYIFRHRCLVCGRVYCRQCVSIGMGEMTEGRKCIECLGRRFSQRYIQRAGKVGCCMGYPSMVKQQELSWAEKGPRRSGENRYGHSVMVSRSRSPVTPRTPTRPHSPTNPPSFVVSSPYSPYSPSNHHPLPF